eukprot:Stramenopile-MAST_4_protein_3785
MGNKGSTSRSGARNFGSGVSGHRTLEHWECKACTFLNETLSDNCRMCRKKRGSQGTPVSIVTARPPKLPKADTTPIEEKFKNFIELGLVHFPAHLQVLLTIVQNIEKHPSEMKFRRLRLGNAKLKPVLNVIGVKEFLCALGFQKKEGDALVLSRIDMGLIWAARCCLQTYKVNSLAMGSKTKKTGTTEEAKTEDYAKTAVSAKIALPDSKKEANHPSGTAQTSGKLKVETEMEKRLRKLAKVMAVNPVAFDTIVTIVAKIQENPDDRKFRRLRWSNKKFEDTVRYAPGATTFLKEIGFEDTEDALVMNHANHALLWVASACLDVEKKSSVYKKNIALLEFEQVMNIFAQSSSNVGECEEEKRSKFRSQLPGEPAVGEMQQTRICIILGKTRFERRFYTDCTLVSVMNYAGSINSIIPRKVENKDWEFVNSTMYPPKKIDYACDKDKTLYSLDLWPSGTLELRLVT